MGKTYGLDTVVAKTLDGQLVHDEVKGAIDLAPEDRVWRNQSVADYAGKVRLLVILGKECEVGRVLVDLIELSHG